MASATLLRHSQDPCLSRASSRRCAPQVLGEYCALLSLDRAAAESLDRALQQAAEVAGGEEAAAAALAAAGIKSLRAEDVRSLLARGPRGDGDGDGLL